MIDLTLVMAVYGQPEMLEKQLSTINGYPRDVKSHLGLVVVDDCGDPPVSQGDIGEMELFCGLKSAKLLRITQDIPWNQMGARNLGMHVSSGWCIMIDPDMVFDGDMMHRMMEAAEKLERGQLIKYHLRHINKGTLDGTSPNTYLIHRDDFFAVGGYDEDFAGNKGWSDVQMLDILKSSYRIEHRPDLHADFYGNDTIPDAMVTKLDRSTAVNRKKRIKKTEQARKARGWAQWAKTRVDIPRLRFPWVQVYPKA